MILKILTVAFAVFALRRVIIRYRRGGTMTLEFLFWAFLFSGVGIVVFVPQAADRFARWIGVSSGFNALVFIAVTGLMFAVYRLFVRTQVLERDITRLVRTQSLNTPEAIAPRAEPASPPPSLDAP